MKVHYGFPDSSQIANAVVTTGSFDGVHVGHKVIIDRLKRRARELQGESVLITFYPHPRTVLYPETAGKNLMMINSQVEKIKLLEKLGLDHLIIVEFTMDFSRTSSVDFIRKLLVSRLQVKHVIIGFNHHFGHKREGDLEYLLELGKFYNFSVEEIPEQDIHNESVSSTKIRKSLKEGYIQRANAYLDHPYVLSGHIGSAQNFEEIILYPLNSFEDEKLLPPAGGYAISYHAGDMRCKGGLWITQDTTHNILLSLEANVGFALDQTVIFEFHKRISEGLSLADISALEIERDLQIVEELIY